MGIGKNKLTWYKNYLEEYYKILKQITKKELANFKGLNINSSKSYFVLSEDELLLKKFACFYLMSKTVNFNSYMMYDFASGICNPSEEMIESDVIVLYCHKHVYDIGKTEDWMGKTILCKIASRNRRGDRTILLTERDLPSLRNSGEFEVITLSSSTFENSTGKDISNNSTSKNTYDAESD